MNQVIQQRDQAFAALQREAFLAHVSRMQVALDALGTRQVLQYPVTLLVSQRIVHGAHETNYCAQCQTGGKLLADRSLSRLLKSDWPRTLDELEARARPPAG